MDNRINRDDFSELFESIKNDMLNFTSSPPSFKRMLIKRLEEQLRPQGTTFRNEMSAFLRAMGEHKEKIARIKALLKLIYNQIEQLKDLVAAAGEELPQFNDEQAAVSEVEKLLVEKIELEALVQRTEDEVEELSEVVETEKKQIEIRMKQFKKLFTSTASQVARERMESEGKYPVM